MTDSNNQEPTMEEILASIRRIISEDDPPAESTDATPPHGDNISVPADEPAPAPMAFEPEPAEEDDVLELTERVDPPSAPVESVGDLDVFPTAAPPPPPAPAAASEPAWSAPSYAAPAGEGLVSAPTASSAASAFAALSQSITMPRDDRTLEDVVRELLRPLLSQWLDANLPRIVETAVQAEVERIARRNAG